MRRQLSYLLCAGIIVAAASCSKDQAAPPIIVSDGTSQTLSGGPGGASATNSIFLHISGDKQDSVARSSWDLGFYCGSDFRVIINNTTTALAKVLSKNDLAQVGTTDTVGIKLAISYSVSDFAMIDTITGDLNKTVIPAVSATDAGNYVVILNRGTGGGVTAKPWIKLRVLRNSNGYTLQYAGIAETTFKTVTITKDDSYNFKYVSLDNGAAVTVEPKARQWDLEWTYAMYQTPYNGGYIPYAFSDMVLINKLGGVTAAEILTSRVSYANYSDTSVANTVFSSDRHVIGANWRSTQPATGVATDRFYVIKDATGNVYKLKFNSMGVNDGGTRGYPQLEYKLVKKG